ncbi:hypothetical protein [Polyangium spumosum]|uniref:Uncharacterized protein n=1 Tax=Polyangium spumosum TaxID=889282 RepID=A0A6N7Q194_9BACT|nr:hypothetical protein [Polyangium spumosum]MRG97819.1 hypothetical protein [Polyangium spumosum]
MLDLQLALPTDIPWRRIAVSRDMLVGAGCAENRPQRFRSSLAAFRYDPPEEYQQHPEHVVSYIKIVATIAPYAPDISALEDDLGEYVPPDVVDVLEQSLPCYGALLEVAVSPLPEDAAKFPVEEHPYFIDFEPKKREIYEAVTDTGEVLSGSASHLSTGKSATSTTTLEEYDLDLGYAFSGSVSAGAGPIGGGLSASGDDRKQVGTVKQNAYQSQHVTTSDRSTERREVHSHSTQLTQMYNLFQAYHLGTNRAVFMIEPRPHVRQVASTFIHGPRALEGIQEVFLVVVRPKAMKEFCVSAYLETAHVAFGATSSHDHSTLTWKLHLEREFDKDSQTLPEPVVWTAPAGWVVDQACGVKCNVTAKQGAQSNPTFQITDDTITASAQLLEGGSIDAEVVAYVRPAHTKNTGAAQRLFLSARRLCSCPHDAFAIGDWVPFELDLNGKNLRFYEGAMTPSAFYASRRFATAIREGMIRSLGSTRRTPHGEMPFLRSDAFFTIFLNALRASGGRYNLDEPITAHEALVAAAQVQLSERGVATLGDVLSADPRMLSRATGTDATAVKRAILAAVLRPRTA